MRQMMRLIQAFCILLMACGACFSGDAMIKSANASENVPEFISGGIGSDDPIEFVKMDYNVHLVFAAKGSGEYLADVKVTIQSASGAMILETLSPGPLFYVKLPSGSYRITAEYLGKHLTRSVSIEGMRSRDLYFYWDLTAVQRSESYQ